MLCAFELIRTHAALCFFLFRRCFYLVYDVALIYFKRLNMFALPLLFTFYLYCFKSENIVNIYLE